MTYWYDSQDPPIPEQEREALNGYRPNGIQDPLAYKVRPLNGIWATPPYLHNGSVPNVYALLSPVSERPKSFYLGRREYDPICMGYHITARAAPMDNLDLRCLGDRANTMPAGFRAASNSTPRFAVTATLAMNSTTGGMRMGLSARS